MIKFEYKVIERYKDEPSEVFGFCQLPGPPNAGDVIQLRWLDGSEAYKARVEHVGENELKVVRV